MIACQYADLCIPVEVSPNAVIGEIKTECCGSPVINCAENPRCKTCEITIEQKICIRIPIRCTATARTGDAKICCRECGCRQE